MVGAINGEFTMDEVTKICTRCMTDLPISEFYQRRDRASGYKSECRSCGNSRYRPKVRDNHLRVRYGITGVEVDVMHEIQGFKCRICDRRFDRLCVDHDHVTGKIRALLCRSCNRGIGYLQDDVDLLSRAVSYLKEFG